MSSSPHARKFLLDENVRSDLYKFLTREGFDAKLVPKTGTDAQVASLSKKENRILVTNDEDFTQYSKDYVFSVVWLRIPQNDASSLLSSFKNLIKNLNDFEGKLVVLEKGKWNEFPLMGEVQV